MIADAVLGWLLDAADWVRSLLPVHHLDLPDMTSAVGYLDDINYFLPLGEVFAAVLAVIAVGPAFFVTSIVAWLLVGVARGGSPRA